MNECIKHTTNLYLAPLQGYTNADYRNLHQKYFAGINKYVSPYLRFEPHKSVKNSVLKDLNPNNNKGVYFVPQILGKNTSLFVEWAKQFENWGYKEFNWNLGCPYPMVTKRGLGSALLKEPEKVRNILDAVMPKINIPLSIKCRLGFEQPNEIGALLEVFNDFPLEEITIHARTAKQMYKGKAYPNLFVDLINRSKHKLVYNGDINTVEDYTTCRVLFKDKVDGFMLGRGILMNPFLASEIKGEFFSNNEKREILIDFHSELYELNKQKLEPSHLLGRMLVHWEYLSFIFKNQHKIFKAIKKTRRVDKYERLIERIMLEEIIR